MGESEVTAFLTHLAAPTLRSWPDRQRRITSALRPLRPPQYNLVGQVERSQRPVQKRAALSGFLSHDLAVAPDIDRGTVGTGGFAGHAGGTAQGAPNGCRKGRRMLFFSFHGPCSIRRGVAPALSYTAHASASGR